jgi:hypothetical protein
MKYLFLILVFVAGLTVTARAQQAVTASKVTAEIIASSATAIVKGAPFSAEAISESTQILADGNKISRTFTTRMYRDGEGRFRREEVPGTGGAFLGANQFISIIDPVGNYRYILDPAKKTARRFGIMPGSAEGAVVVNGQPMSASLRAQVETNAIQRTNIVVLPSAVSSSSTSKSESLGTRSFDGLEAEGTRMTTTIPAGTIGNERPIETVYEKWYSKDLQLIVYSKHSDPRFGEQIYRLDNIDRGEPDRSLFTPPADYKLVTEPTYTLAPRPAVITPRPVIGTRKPE